MIVRDMGGEEEGVVVEDIVFGGVGCCYGFDGF